MFSIDKIINFLQSDTTINFLEKYGVPTAIAIIVIAVIVEIVKALPILFQPENVQDPEYFISLKNVEEMRKTLRRLKFSASPDFWDADIHELQACYNGIGPSKWCPRYRIFIAKALNVIDGSILIHDYEWENCDRTFFSFIMINLKLISNTFRESRYRNNKKIVVLGFLLAFINIFLGWRLFKGSIL